MFKANGKHHAGMQLLRVISFLLVVTIHVVGKYVFVPEGALSVRLVALYPLLDLCVPLFFLISGYFLFSTRKPTFQVVGKGLARCLIPCVLLLFFMLWAGPLFDGNEVVAAGEVPAYAASLLLRFSVHTWHTYHLWFLLFLAVIYLWFPLLRFVCVDTPEANKVRRYIEVFLFALFFLRGNLAWFFPFVGEWLAPVQLLPNYSFLYILLGYEVRQLAGSAFLLNKTKRAVLCGSMLVFGLGLGLWGTLRLDVSGTAWAARFVGYDAVPMLIAGLGAFVWFAFWDVKAGRRFWIYLGDRVYLAYIVHVPIIHLVLAVLSPNRPRAGLGNSLLYMGVPILLAAGLSFAFSTLVHEIYLPLNGWLKRQLEQIKSRKAA